MTSIYVPPVPFLYLITPSTAAAAPDRKKMYTWLGVGAVALVLMQITLPKN